MGAVVAATPAEKEAAVSVAVVVAIVVVAVVVVSGAVFLQSGL